MVEVIKGRTVDVMDTRKRWTTGVKLNKFTIGRKKEKNDVAFSGHKTISGMAWHGMAWHGMAWHRVAWRGVVWRGVVWRGLVWSGAVRRGATPLRAPTD